MSALQCEICGGNLIGKPGGVFRCEGCGMEYDISWAQAKLQEIQGKRQEDPLSGLARARERIAKFRNAVAVCGDSYLIAIGKDGRVRFSSVGLYAHEFAELEKWSDIVSVSAGFALSAGLRKDGTVVAAGNNAGVGSLRSDVGKMRSVMEITSSGRFVVGLKTDGAIASTDSAAQAIGALDPSKWNALVSVNAGEHHLIGLKKDGSVIAQGNHSSGVCDVSDWKHVVQISTSDFCTLGLRDDGTVLASRFKGKQEFNRGQFDVHAWRNIVSVCAGCFHSLGLRDDGTVEAAGDNRSGQCDVSDWKDIVAVYAGKSCSLGLNRDGRLLIAGRADWNLRDVQAWKLFDNPDDYLSGRSLSPEAEEHRPVSPEQAAKDTFRSGISRLRADAEAEEKKGQAFDPFEFYAKSICEKVEESIREQAKKSEPGQTRFAGYAALEYISALRTDGSLYRAGKRSRDTRFFSCEEVIKLPLFSSARQYITIRMKPDESGLMRRVQQLLLSKGIQAGDPVFVVYAGGKAVKTAKSLKDFWLNELQNSSVCFSIPYSYEIK